jgi:hypothetical protein
MVCLVNTPRYYLVRVCECVVKYAVYVMIWGKGSIMREGESRMLSFLKTVVFLLHIISLFTLYQ